MSFILINFFVPFLRYCLCESSCLKNSSSPPNYFFYYSASPGMSAHMMVKNTEEKLEVSASPKVTRITVHRSVRKCGRREDTRCVGLQLKKQKALHSAIRRYNKIEQGLHSKERSCTERRGQRTKRHGQHCCRSNRHRGHRQLGN